MTKQSYKFIKNLFVYLIRIRNRFLTKITALAPAKYGGSRLRNTGARYTTFFGLAAKLLYKFSQLRPYGFRAREKSCME